MRILLVKLGLPFVLLLTLYRPFFGALFFILTGYVRPEAFTRGVQDLRIALLTSVVTLVSWLIHMRNPAERAHRIPGQFWLYLVMVAATVASALGAEASVESAWSSTVKLVKYSGFLFLMTQMINTEQRLRAVQETMFAGVSLLVLWGFEQHFQGNERLERVGGGDFTDSSDLAALMVLTLPMVLYRMAHPWRLVRWSSYLMAPLYLIVITFTQSRSGFLGSLAVLALFYLRSNKKLFYLMAAVPIGLVLITAMPDTFLDRMSTIVEPVDNPNRGEERERSADSRLKLWAVAWAVFKDHPMLGVGRDNFGLIHERYAAPIWYGRIDDELYADLFYRFRVCHNVFLDILVSSGLLTLIPWCLLMLTVPWSLAKARKHLGTSEMDGFWRGQTYAIDSGVLGFLIVGGFQDLTEMEAFYWVVMLGGITRVVLERRGMVQLDTGLEVNHEEESAPLKLRPSSPASPTRPVHVAGNPWYG